MGKPCMILDITAEMYWQPFKSCRRIDQQHLATVLHPSREVAEEEALRLTNAHPGRRYAVFEVVSAVHTVKVPTQVSWQGKVQAEQSLVQLVKIEDDDVPF